MRVLIVDDHPIVISGCKALLAADPKIEVAEAGDGNSGFDAYHDLVIWYLTVAYCCNTTCLRTWNRGLAKNAVIGLQQARARYENAVNSRVLAEETLKAEQNRYKYGVSDLTLVIQAERDLNLNRGAEVQAMANYTHAKIAFDEAIGRTLEVNNISIEEAAAGRVARQSAIPESLPAVRK